MPEPVTHLLFFLYVFSAVAIYAGIKLHIKRRAARKHDIQILMIMAIGGFCSILPDIDTLYNYITMGQLTHGNLMPITHNLLASYFAFMFATWIEYIIMPQHGQSGIHRTAWKQCIHITSPVG